MPSHDFMGGTNLRIIKKEKDGFGEGRPFLNKNWGKIFKSL